MARDCASEPKGRRGSSRRSWRGQYRGGPRGDGQNRGVRVNLVSTDKTTQVRGAFSIETAASKLTPIALIAGNSGLIRSLVLFVQMIQILMCVHIL